MQKISGTFRSDNGADAFFAIHSIADSAWKNKQSQLNAINTILSLQDGNDACLLLLLNSYLRR